MDLELQDLRRRIAALEEMVFRKHAVRKTVIRILENWPGPFTAQQIEQALRELNPEMAASLKPYSILNQISRFEKDGILARTMEGRGRNSAVFERVGRFPDGTRPGPRFGRTASYESGFRNIVRRALADLPERFKLDDLREWMATNMPTASIPYGSWSSTLYKLQQQGELIVVENRSKTASCNRKVYSRGPKRVAPTGEEIRALESSWQDFREAMKIRPIPDAFTPTAKRAEGEVA